LVDRKRRLNEVSREEAFHFKKSQGFAGNTQ
jgi:hypothetical protein